MNYIFIDFEFNGVYNNKGKSNIKRYELFEKYNLSKFQEIIEIGAVKTDENFEILDTFRIFVKPTIFKTINPVVTQLTNITNDDLNFGFDFNKSIRIFKTWIKDEDFKLFTWGDSDEIAIKENCSVHYINSDWFNCIDVQEYHMKTINFNNYVPMSLKRVVGNLKLERDKEFHTALNDAIYTMQILKYITQNYNMSLLNNIINKRKNSNLFINKYLNREIKCEKCGKIIKDISIPFVRLDKYGVVGECSDCNMFYYKYITFKFDKYGDFHIIESNILKVIPFPKFDKYKKVEQYG